MATKKGSRKLYRYSAEFKLKAVKLLVRDPVFPTSRRLTYPVVQRKR